MNFVPIASITAATILCTLRAVAQVPQFEVATIKPADSTVLGRVVTGVHEGTFQAQKTPLKGLLAVAYNVQTFRVSGPAWLDSTMFDVVAKLPGGAAENRWPMMLQALLVDRFHIEFHRETKEMDVFEMVPAKGGLKIPFDTAKMPKDLSNLGGLMTGGTVTMSQLGDSLSRDAGRPVVDGTGMEGSFLYFLNYDPRFRPADAAPSSTPDLFNALQDQLGIKLEPKKASLDIIVIDEIERTPSEN